MTTKNSHEAVSAALRPFASHCYTEVKAVTELRCITPPMRPAESIIR